MAHTPPTGTLWALLAIPDKPEQPPPPPSPSPSLPLPPGPPPMAAKEELLLRIQEALHNHEFSSPQKPQLPNSPQTVSIWGVPLTTDTVLLKFLKAKNYNVDESFSMLKNTIQWRRKFDIDGLINQPEDIMDDVHRTVYVNGHDKAGHPVWYFMYGEFQHKEMYTNTFSDENKRTSFVKRVIGILERNIRKLDFGVAGVSTFLMVVDFKNSSVSDQEKEVRIAWTQLHQLLQENYPEFVEKRVFINVSRCYWAIRSVTDHLLPGETEINSKLIMTGQREPVDTLLKYISPGNLPIQYGGFNRQFGSPEFVAHDAATEIEIKEKTLTKLTVDKAPKRGVHYSAGAKGSGMGSDSRRRIQTRSCGCISLLYQTAQEKENDA